MVGAVAAVVEAGSVTTGAVEAAGAKPPKPVESPAKPKVAGAVFSPGFAFPNENEDKVGALVVAAVDGATTVAAVVVGAAAAVGAVAVEKEN